MLARRTWANAGKPCVPPLALPALGRAGLVCPGLPCQLILEYESRIAAPPPLSVCTLPYLAVRAVAARGSVRVERPSRVGTELERGDGGEGAADKSDTQLSYFAQKREWPSVWPCP